MPDRVFVVVVTGGPMGGKSTLMDAIRKRYGSSVSIVHEGATILLANVPKLPANSAEGNAFQQALLALQSYNEMVAIADAHASGVKIVVLDRGILDSAAYIDGGLKQLESMLGRTRDEVYDSIDAVIHLETVAVCHPGMFGTTGNPHRVENHPDAAVAIDRRLKSIWGGHLNWTFVPCAGGIDAVIARAIKVIDELIYRENERKWLAKYIQPPDDYVSVEVIEQFYVAFGSKGEQRFRKIENNGTVEFLETFKSGSGLSRTENEEPRTQVEYEIAQQGARGTIIHKRRYNYPDGRGAVISLDLFDADLAGHATLEREFTDAKEAENYNLPAEWQELVIQEVTGNSAYSNRNLSQSGLP